ncbi:MATE family efflux transporter [Marinoscillum furvescens]|uniref:Na+-driven multidrug efflux pump n=1 Tax=Marinoscillum furvescens DSM 4134 TaxID=1122208 RepID=A0A3D9L8P5_MARFU|nr:MATE family efflux transporter [Marinoscillum furvescens]REE02046.1 Na+-driven multidrug efflux pump [Marinoscillum furvescens DSM 4134]
MKDLRLLSDSPFRLLLRLSVPGMLGMLVLSINSLVDAVYLGNLLSAEAFAGVSLVFPFTLIVSSFTGLLAVGFSSMLSRAIGRGDVPSQEKILPNLIVSSCICSGLVMAVGYCFAGEIMDAMGAQGVVRQFGVAYLETYACGVFFSVFGLSANALIRAEGKMKQAMMFTVVAVAINLVLTPFFITTLNMGVEGAAWSSIVAMLVYSAGTYAYFLCGKALFSVGKVAISLDREVMMEVAKVGVSSLLLQLANVLRQFVVFRFVTWYGSAHDLIVFSAAYRLFSFVAVPVLGIMQPLQPVIGVNFGAGEWQRCLQALKVFQGVGVLFACLLITPILLFPSWFVGLLIPDIILMAGERTVVRVIFGVLPFLPLASSAIIYFQAVGQSKIASFLPVGRQVILFLPFVALLAATGVWGSFGIYYMLGLENVIYALLAVWILRREARAYTSYSFS